MISPLTLILLFLSLPSLLIRATNITGSTDYGFGILWLSYTTNSSSSSSSSSSSLSRCSNVSFTIGGGFSPYTLDAVSAGGNNTRNITLNSDGDSANWQVSLSEGSYVAFNLTDRAGATVQSNFLSVGDSSDGESCGNDTSFKSTPKSSSGSSSSSSPTDNSGDGVNRRRMGRGVIGMVAGVVVSAFSDLYI